MSKILGIGTDIVKISRFEKILENYDIKRLEKLFSKQELEYCISKKLKKKIASSLALRFAAKEAFIKAIGWSIWKIPLNKICVLNNDHGAPMFSIDDKISTKCLNFLLDKGFHNLNSFNAMLSLSDDEISAIAFVIIESN